MTTSEIEAKAAFDHIRYAQLWEDADVLTQALGDCAGGGAWVSVLASRSAGAESMEARFSAVIAAMRARMSGRRARE